MSKVVFFRTTILAGVLTGLAAFGLALLLFYTGQKPLGKHLFLFLPVYAAGMMLGLTYFRNFKNKGILRGFQALPMALLINLLASVFFASSLYLFLRWGSDAMLLQHHQDLINLLEVNKTTMIAQTSKEIFEQKLQSIQEVSKGSIATDVFLKSSFLGVFVALLVGLGLRKTK
jgi:4-amino-4-deoxy-L-arabinose transferase-like glycosyltransferase